MARKNTLFDVDIMKENPLITIVNHGKIPVVQMSDVPFYNKKVERWYRTYDGMTTETICRYKEIIKGHKEKGLNNITYCNIGGFHGAHFSHYYRIENINIGYCEPNELVYDPTSKTYISAERKLKSVKRAWESLLKKENETEIIYGKWSYFTEHFAEFQNVWMDSKHIRKVCIIHTTDFKDFLPFLKDGYLGIGCIDDLFHSLWNEKIFDKDYLKHIDAPDFYKEWDKKCEKEFDVRYEVNHDFMEHNSGYERKVFEELFNHYTGKPYSYTKEYFQEYKSASVKFHAFLKEWCAKDSNVTRGYNYGLNDWFFSENYLNTYLHYQESIQIQFWDGKLYVRKYKNYQHRELEAEEIFQNKYRYCMYEFLMLFDVFYGMFKELYKIEYPSILRQVEKYKKLEDLLKQNMCQYEVNDIDNIIVIFEKDFQIEYNLVLKDAVVIVPNTESKYYNIDSVPSEYRSEKMNEIMEILLGGFS